MPNYITESFPKRKMPPLLDQIVAAAKATLPGLRARRAELERQVANAPRVPSFRAALAAGTTLGLVAEVKRRSPSAGTIRADLDPAIHAARYAEAGASAVSVLTEGPHFGGSMSDLQAVRRETSVPLLRKDFILDELQLLEARAAGASAALLIVRILSPDQLARLIIFARDIGLDTLVEAHTAGEVDAAMAAGGEIIGVNSRDLDTFKLDPEGAWRLLHHVPRRKLAVAESAMHTLADVQRAAEAGADAVLIGTALSAAGDPAPFIREIRKVARRAR